MTVAALREKVTALCLALPEASTKPSHGMDAFQAGRGKMFAYFTHDHHGDGITAVLVKTSGPDEQAMLVEADPETFYRPAYLSPYGWIGLRIDRGPPDWEQVEDRVRASYRLTATKRLAAGV